MERQKNDSDVIARGAGRTPWEVPQGGAPQVLLCRRVPVFGPSSQAARLAAKMIQHVDPRDQAMELAAVGHDRHLAGVRRSASRSGRLAWRTTVSQLRGHALAARTAEGVRASVEAAKQQVRFVENADDLLPVDDRQLRDVVQSACAGRRWPAARQARR